MDDFKKLLQDKPLLAMVPPAILNFVSFFSNLFASFKDGVINGNDFHELSSFATGFEGLILVLIMYAFKDTNTK